MTRRAGRRSSCDRMPSTGSTCRSTFSTRCRRYAARPRKPSSDERTAAQVIESVRSTITEGERPSVEKWRGARMGLPVSGAPFTALVRFQHCALRRRSDGLVCARRLWLTGSPHRSHSCSPLFWLLASARTCSTRPAATSLRFWSVVRAGSGGVACARGFRPDVGLSRRPVAHRFAPAVHEHRCVSQAGRPRD
jgi:hypothetical protein